MSSNPSFPGSAPNDAAKDAMNTAADAAKQAADRASELGRDAAHQAADLGRSTVDRLDSTRGPVAEGLHRTADAIRSYAPGTVGDQARSAADAVDSAAGYIRSRDVRSMASDLTDAVRKNPGPSLIAAVAVGFLLGMTMRRND